jgi:fibronectin type 3 domain-containing protein
MLSCGKRKPPQPPLERVVQRVQVSGFQRGDQIRLQWTLPVRNAGKGSVLNINRVDVYRLAEPLNSTPSLTEEEFAAGSTLITSLPIKEEDFTKKTLTYFDKLDFAGQSIRLRYAVRFVNASGSKAGFSNFFLIEPTAKIANSPSLSTIKVSQDVLTLYWVSPEANIDSSKPANIIGYNVYRASTDDETARLLNQTPLTQNEFKDANFEFEKNYKYFVRTVSLGTEAEPIESQESNILEVAPKDIFPPSPPSGITLAASPTTISIFFVSNPEIDVVGYKIYRSIDNVAWQVLTDKLLQTNTFQDTKVESGKTYYYYLIAVDKYGNESEKSEVIKEIVP